MIRVDFRVDANDLFGGNMHMTLTGARHGDASTTLLRFYQDKADDLAESGQYYMAAVALSLALEASILSYLLVEFDDDNGGELEIPASIGMFDLIEAANKIDVLNAPIGGGSHEFGDPDTAPPKHIAKDVVHQIREFRNLIHPARAIREGFDPRTFGRPEFDDLREMYASVTHGLLYFL